MSIRFRPKKIRGFGGVPKVHTAVTLQASSSEYLAICKLRKLNTSLNDSQFDMVYEYDIAVTGYTDRHFCNVISLKCPA